MPTLDTRRCAGPHNPSRRRFVSLTGAWLGTVGLNGCGGDGTDPTPVSGTTTPAAASIPPAAAPAPPTVQSQIADSAPDAVQADTGLRGAAVGTLVIQSTTAGTYPYSATVMPMRGTVPAGSTIASPDEPNLRASVLSTYDDGSVALAVASGHVAVAANATASIRLQVAAPDAQPKLTASAITALVQSIHIDFGTTLGAANVTDLGSPERVWWATPGTICARYRAAAAAPGISSLEAVIDVQAWPGRALVEIVVENCLMDSVRPVKPGAANYSAATVSVNGRTVTTVNGNAAPDGNHAPFRSWYASTWVGGNPGLRVTHSPDDLQRHPLMWKTARSSAADLSGYGNDSYVPWTSGRQRESNMGGTGDHASIGPLPQWEARALQSGDRRAWNATEVSALAVLGFNINYRDSGTGLVTTLAQIGTRAIASRTWPAHQPGGGGGRLEWELAHHPAVGLMAFVGRPSPVFIELAQKVALWCGSWSSDSTPNWQGGVFGFWCQTRGRAWGLRSLTHATFLTPAGDAWRTSGLSAISLNVNYLDSFRNDSKAVLNTLWDGTPSNPRDFRGDIQGWQNSVWQVHYLICELHRTAACNLLAGSAQVALDALADWAALHAVRWVNEQPNGGWRYLPYETTMGQGTPIMSQATWSAERNRPGNHTDAPPGVSGPWMSHAGCPSAYAAYAAQTSASAYYPTYFWAALVAARERNVPNAATAWSTVQTGIANLPSWMDGFAIDPRWGATPRTA